MPNRMLRDWTDSDKINNLTVWAERFFVRLIMKVDDYGCFFADTRLLKAHLFPLILDRIKDIDISKWLSECQNQGLIILYEINNKSYLEIKNFEQRLRAKNRKYPCRSNDGQMPAECRPEVEEKIEQEVEEKRNVFSPPDKQDLINYFINEKNLDDFTAMGEGEKFMTYYESNGWKVGKNKMKNWKSAAAGWVLRMNDFKNKNNGTKNFTTSNKQLGEVQITSLIRQDFATGRKKDS